jgi:hypothetical protein
MSVLRQKPEAPVRWLPEDISKALQVIEAMGTKGADWKARIVDWKARLLSGDGKACGGLILALVPNLVKLQIEILATGSHVFEKVWTYKRYAFHPLDKLFGASIVHPQVVSVKRPSLTPNHFPDPDILAKAVDTPNGRGQHRPRQPPSTEKLPLDLSQVCGLGKLQTLRFFGSRLDKDWCILPKLQCLEVARDCNCPILTNLDAHNALPNVSLAVVTLQLELATFAAIGRDRHKTLNPFFLSRTSFPHLQNLYIKLTNLQWRNSRWNDGWRAVDILEPWDLGSTALIISHLGPISAGLKTFSLETYDTLDSKFLAIMAPIKTLETFEKLESFTVTQELLLGQQPEDPINLLPASIRVLKLLHPTATSSLFDWLVKLNERVDAFPDLKAVHLLCGSFGGDRYPAVYEKYEVLVKNHKLQYKLTIHPTDQRARSYMRSRLPKEIYVEKQPEFSTVLTSDGPTAVPLLDDDEAFPPLGSLSLRK